MLHLSGQPNLNFSQESRLKVLFSLSLNLILNCNSKHHNILDGCAFYKLSNTCETQNESIRHIILLNEVKSKQELNW